MKYQIEELLHSNNIKYNYEIDYEGRQTYYFDIEDKKISIKIIPADFFATYKQKQYIIIDNEYIKFESINDIQNIFRNIKLNEILK